jgi:hypothetical protein
VTYVDVVAMRRAAMTSRSSIGDSGVMEPVARQCLCKQGDYETILEALFSDRCPSAIISETVATLESVLERESVLESREDVCVREVAADRVEPRSAEEYRRLACEDLASD